MADAEANRVLATVWRMESPKIIAALARITGDVEVAEDLAEDAFVQALEKWPHRGVPEQPAAWLMLTARNRAIDQVRRRGMLNRKHEELGREAAQRQEESGSEYDAVLEEDFGDDLLRLMFIACHPVLSVQARVALTLRLLGGLTTEEIARAFLTTEATVAQRIVRAKRALSNAGIPFELPGPEERAARLSSVLEVVYLIFNEGYAATAGDDWMRPDLCEEALRLGRVLAGLMPGDAEVHGLVALMEIQASRVRARTGSDGEPILLLDQDRARWDRLLIRRGLASLKRAEALAAEAGTYTLQAAIAACHARARAADETDWARIAALYGELAALTPSPVIELNRAVAVSMADGPAAGLALVEALTDEPVLRGYHLLPSVRGDLLVKVGRHAEAAGEFERAANLTRNARERAILRARAESCRAGDEARGEPA